MMPSHTVRILVATQPVDFRKGHDGLAALVQSVLKEDPGRVAKVVEIGGRRNLRVIRNPPEPAAPTAREITP